MTKIMSMDSALDNKLCNNVMLATSEGGHKNFEFPRTSMKNSISISHFPTSVTKNVK